MINPTYNAALELQASAGRLLDAALQAPADDRRAARIPLQTALTSIGKALAALEEGSAVDHGQSWQQLLTIVAEELAKPVSPWERLPSETVDANSPSQNPDNQ